MRAESRDVDAADVDTENSIEKILEYHRNEVSWRTGSERCD